MEEYITNSEFEILLEDIQDKLDHQKIEECRAMLTQIIDDGKKQNKYNPAGHKTAAEQRHRNREKCGNHQRFYIGKFLRRLHKAKQRFYPFNQHTAVTYRVAAAYRGIGVYRSSQMLCPQNIEQNSDNCNGKRRQKCPRKTIELKEFSVFSEWMVQIAFQIDGGYQLAKRGTAISANLVSAALMESPMA